MTGRLAGLTHVGETRGYNEDGFLIFDMALGEDLTEVAPDHVFDGNPLVLAVSDGMGGASAGEVASEIALEAIRDHAGGAMDWLAGADVDSLAGWLVEGIQRANQRVWTASTEDEALKGMGATLTVAVVYPGAVVVGHVGDSRAYQHRDGEFIQLTKDQTFVEELIARGTLTAEDAQKHPQRHVLLQAVGVRDVLEVESLAVPLSTGDRLLLCSDGLYDLVPDGMIAGVLASDLDPGAQCRSLVTTANSHGGYDNVTAVILHIN